MEPERPWALEADVRQLQSDVGQLKTDVAGLRSDVGHLQGGVAAIRIDLRRVDDRLFQMMLIQLGTLVAALASVVTAVLT